MEDDRPLAEYAALAGAFGAVLAGFLFAASPWLPERISLVDTVRIGLASYKLGRLIAKDPVASFVRAPVTEDLDATEPKREGAARALGELVTCPYCIGLWIALGSRTRSSSSRGKPGSLRRSSAARRSPTSSTTASSGFAASS